MLKEEISKYLSPLLSSSKLRAKLFHSLVLLLIVNQALKCNLTQNKLDDPKEF